MQHSYAKTPFLPARRTLSAAAALTALFTSGCQTPPPVPADSADLCALSNTDFSGWFESSAVSLNGVVKPADSLNNLSPNCGFYAWSEQMFLWLNSPAPAAYGGGAHIFDSPAFYDVTPPDVNDQRTFLSHTPGLIRAFPLRVAQRGPHGLPVIMDRSGTLFEFNPPDANSRPLVRGPGGNVIEIAHARLDDKGRAILLDREGAIIQAQHLTTATRLGDVLARKESLSRNFLIDGISLFIDPSLAVIDVEQGQAETSGVLEAQTAVNGSLVYYATMVNDVYAYFLTGVKNGAITTTPPNQFPTTIADLNQTIAYASAHGKGSTPFPDPNALAVEVKSSWVLAAGLPNLASYITMEATIPVYDRSNPDIWNPTGQQTVKLALVGMHVVGSTFTHPEMVWATFEHDGNTPPADYTYNATGGPKTVTQNTSGTWLFSATGSAGPFNTAHMAFTGPPNNQIKAAASFHISPSDTLRTNPWGVPGGIASSNSEVISMNHHVRSMLAGGDVRANYMMTGATWTPFGSPPSDTNLGVGANRLANTTMETYQQGNTNCFSCHQTFQMPPTLNPNGISHIFGGATTGLKPLF